MHNIYYSCETQKKKRGEIVLKVKKYRELVELKGILRQKKINYETLANLLEISLSALSNKINGYSLFDILEVDKISKIIKIKREDIVVYFF